jgi:soluble lytic murein transglycosylase-like protein
MKCQTARGIGYRGSCNGLLDARTGVQVGLKHLALAIKSSGGNLKLAASKHNGGLGRKTLVRKYVAAVF